MPEIVDQFAVHVRAFAQWAKSGDDTGIEAARNGLFLITRVYLAGLELCSDAEYDEAVSVDVERVNDSEWQAVLRHAGRLPINLYGIADPLVLTPDTHLVGDLTDDIADLYRDLVTGLRLYESGRKSAALWYWRLMMPTHWGDHATAAIRALDRWIAA